MKHFKLPDLGEGLQEAEIVEWHVKAGDSVRADQRLVSVETAKALVDIPAPYDGVVGKLFGAEGDILHVGEPLVGFEGEEADAGTVVGRLEGGGSALEDRFFIGAAPSHPRTPGTARDPGGAPVRPPAGRRTGRPERLRPGWPDHPRRRRGRRPGRPRTLRRRALARGTAEHGAEHGALACRGGAGDDLRRRRPASLEDRTRPVDPPGPGAGRGLSRRADPQRLVRWRLVVAETA
ncbi:branched-chain alpha-keto acid dehydrogenase subunit E2 [Pseudomonas aeruginosa]|nr:branched-chain alpha-keto acid dehydrogenase subunit E2 [Pseudomonas aeruginosa]